MAVSGKHEVNIPKKMKQMTKTLALKNGLPALSIAPMMDWTDRHNRFLTRLIAPHFLLYTEMINALAIRHGDREKLLGFDARESPVALQLGGSDPKALAEAAKIGEDYGYVEINLNAGCPSPRVSAGRFGACLMKEPLHVAECVAAMKSAVSIPVTVKCRIGVDDQNSESHLHHFIRTVSAAGIDTFIVHARKAWLQGLSPKQNREIPPLRYEVVHALKREFPELSIVINGGIKTPEAVIAELAHVDGVMIGRAAYQTPAVLTEIERALFPGAALRTPHEVIQAFLPYVEHQLKHGVRLSNLTRHLLGFFHGEPGSAAFRRYLSEHSHFSHAGAEIILAASQLVAA